MNITKNYELILLLDESLNDSELKSWVFNFAKTLRKFNVSNISVISRGKNQLAYSINKKIKSNYIQLSFSSVPKYNVIFVDKLVKDLKVLRFLLTINKNP